MKRYRYSQKLLLVFLIAAVALIAAQCGAAPQEPAPAVQEEAPVQEQAPPATEEVVATEEVTTEPEPTEEAVVVETEEAPGVIDTEKISTDEVFGLTVETDEPDVSSLRTKRGGEYRIVTDSDAVNFHLYLTSDGPSNTYQGLVYSGQLIGVDEDTLEFIPGASEKYEISDDGLTFTFYLRKDLKWSDGQPITAWDYKWTYDQAMDPANELPYRSQVEFIKSYEALDDYTIQAKIDKIHAPALFNIGLFITPLPKHIWENLPWGDAEKNPEINHPSVVSGPYTLVEWKRDEFVVFEANENYWYHGAPNIDRVIIEIVPDQDIAFQKLKTGESDSSSMSPEQLKEARTFEHVNVYEWWPAQAVWTYIGLNNREGYPTHDINLRHALSYAINKQELTDEIYLGEARRLCSNYAPTTWVHNPDVPCYEYDLDKAMEAFAKAGYTLEGDKLVDENGEQLKLRFLSTNSPTGELFAVSIQDYLKEVGIEMEITSLEWASYLETLKAEEPEWDMFLGAWGTTLEPDSQSNIWHPDSIPQRNTVAYINPKVTTLFEEAAATYDREVRKEKYGEIQRLISEDAPYIFIAYRKSVSVKNKRVQGIEPKAIGIDWNREDWYIVEVEE